jgi:hypothetical protein
LTRILENTRRIFDTAMAAGHASEDNVAIVVGHDGCLRMFCNSDWPLDSLAREHGARESYLVTRRRGNLRVEGHDAGQTCVLQSEPPEQVARRLLSSQPQYPLSAARLLT